MIKNSKHIIFLSLLGINSLLMGMEATKMVEQAVRIAQAATENIVEKIATIEQTLAERKARDQAEAERKAKAKADAEQERTAKVQDTANQQELVAQSKENHETIRRLNERLSNQETLTFVGILVPTLVAGLALFYALKAPTKSVNIVVDLGSRVSRHGLKHADRGWLRRLGNSVIK